MPDFLLDLLIFFPACPSPGMIPCKDIQEIHRLKTHCRGQIPTAVISDTDYYMRLSVASLLEGERSGEQGENRAQGLFPLGSEGKSTAPTHGSLGSAPFLLPSSPLPPPPPLIFRGCTGSANGLKSLPNDTPNRSRLSLHTSNPVLPRRC